MYTDPTHLKVTDPGHIEGNTVFTYLDAFCRQEHFAKYWADYKSLDELKEHYQRGGLGDVKVKKFLNAILEELLEPIRAKRAQYEADIDAVYEILRAGTARAREVAAATLAEMKDAMRINYFEDSQWIETQKKKFE